MAPPRRETSGRTTHRGRNFGIAAAAVIVAVLILIAVYPRGNGTPNASQTAPPSYPSEVEQSWTADPADQLLAPGFDPYPPTFKLPDAAALDGETVAAELSLEPDATAFGGTVGFSFEGTDLASPMWDSAASNIDEMLAGIESPVLRFGGLKGDRRLWWTTSNEPMPEWAEVTVTPADLERVASVADEVDASVTLVVSLARDDPDRAASMAAHAQEIFGDRLLAITIGNEPNGYYLEGNPDSSVRDEGWDIESYQESLEDYAAAIEAESPGTPFSGPGAYDAPWWRAYGDSNLPNKQSLSMHWYPLWNCSGPASSTANPTQDLTSPQLRESANKIIGMGADTAADYGLPLWIEETGPTSCSGGNETSRTHAQALWTSDYVLTAAQLGAERIAFHSTLMACRGGAPMSPLCATGSYESPGEILQGRTSYLALMQLSWIPEGRMLTSVVGGDGTVMVHGVLGDDDSLTIVLVDLRDPAETSDAVPVSVTAPTGLEPDAQASWSPSMGSALTGDSHAAQESSLTAMVPVGPDLAALELSGDQPLLLASKPGTTTLLTLEPTRP